MPRPPRVFHSCDKRYPAPRMVRETPFRFLPETPAAPQQVPIPLLPPRLSERTRRPHPCASRTARQDAPRALLALRLGFCTSAIRHCRDGIFFLNCWRSSTSLRGEALHCKAGWLLPFLPLLG